MVRTFVAACFVLLLAIPAMAQEDYPKMQTSMGYANLGLLDSRHSGFANETSFSLTRTLGLSNYMGIYGLGQGNTLIADFFGGKATLRAARVSPYATAGIGVGYFTDSTTYGSSSFAARVGGGFDVPINDSLSWKFEVSRMKFHIRTTPDSAWTSGTNIAGGIVFTLAN
jgi:opacity protein-like surface antigen